MQLHGNTCKQGSTISMKMYRYKTSNNMCNLHECCGSVA